MDPDIGAWELLHLRGSLSAYYHTGVEDYFVVGLTVIGALLILYMAGQCDKWDFWLSLIAGVALLGVVFFPTARPDKPIPAGQVVPAASCGQATPAPSDCSPIQTLFGETATAATHFGCALVFIALLAILSFIFASRMSKFEPANKYRRVQTLCGCLIIASLAWVAIGHWFNLDIADLTPLHVGELVSVWAFATSWMLKGLSVAALFSNRPMEAKQ